MSSVHFQFQQQWVDHKQNVSITNEPAKDIKMKKTITDNPLVTFCTYGSIRLTSNAITRDSSIR